ncbi:uncharacterized protein LOC113762363 isoform X1 [Coffea eugenioides]|uniref:uncharacterized protein LOC113762363 isoform X1 n=1 Tax=Coffea eugenioides TaxID=49369 RepID=UPI000F615983|nr:uncharacterized protein LOC113762363 isoform X1 [Coffea eugenioides]
MAMAVASPVTATATACRKILLSRFAFRKLRQPPPTRRLVSSVQPRHHCYRAATAASSAGAVEQEVQLIRSPELVAQEYADLSLADKFSEELGHVRIRQHVNPLRSTFMVPAEVPDWNEVYKDPTLPLMVDIGCGSGRFLMWLAKRNPSSKNYLGLEIRRKLAERANYWANDLALNNVHFVFANATVSFKQLISAYPGPFMLVSILCPDPHFKKKYHKRRVVQKPLVESIVDILAPGGQVFIQSDVLELAIDMRDQFDAKSNKLIHVDKIDPNLSCDTEGWLISNPMGIRTEREIHAEFEGARIYRRMYKKCVQLSMPSATDQESQLVIF